MSFKALSELAVSMTQGYFGESVTYKSGITETVVKAVFSLEWIESGGVSTQALTAKINAADVPEAPKKSDEVIRGAKTYKVAVSQANEDETVYTLILKD